MSFVSMAYLLFVGITAAIYYLVPRNSQWIVLLVFSYLFYMASGPKLVFFLLMTTLTTWISALAMEKAEEGPRGSAPGEPGSTMSGTAGSGTTTSDAAAGVAVAAAAAR